MLALLAGASSRDSLLSMIKNDNNLAPPGAGVLERIARDQLKNLPAEFLPHIQGLVVRVDELPDHETVVELELDSAFDLLGLYRGVAINNKSVHDTPTDVDMVFLYRRPILDYWCETGEDLGHLVRHVLIHEIGHHFGFSDDDMEQIENSSAAKSG